MPTLMPKDTAEVLGPNAAECDSRSLLLDRFCDPAAKEDQRKVVFTRAFAKPAYRAKATAWARWLASLSHPSLTTTDLHAQLQSRLMVNMAGGVMENAGLCLDRFGLPYIPGSAVKGCARRTALGALREWCETGSQPTEPDNVFTAACAPFATPAEMLAAIARVFGWCEQDWSERSDQSDFFWACADQHREIRKAVADDLAAHFHWPIEDRHRDTPWKSLPNFAGSVAFLPAYPVDIGKPGKVEGLPLPVPELGKLELDVVTCHHRNYYNEPVEPKGVSHSDPRWQRWKQEHDRWEREWGTAPDTEEPNPVVFPAVAPGHVFTFALAKLRNCSDSDLQSARTWLAVGLQTFGLGAKTNTGYGWFVIVTKATDGTWKSLHDVRLMSNSAPAAGSAALSTERPPSDYDEITFQREVLQRLDRPQDYSLLQKEIKKLQNPANAMWLDKLRAHLAGPAGKEARKRLKEKEWFPKEWLPK